MSRATETLLATIGTDAANDEISAPTVELTTWIDALALTLAAGLRVGAAGLDRDEVANGEADGDVLTVDEVAAMLKLGRNAVYESVNRGEMPHRRIGKQIRFSRHAVMRWLDSWSLQGAKEGK